MVAQARKVRPLSPREMSFAENVLCGLNHTEALRAAAPDLAKRWKPASLRTHASRMATDPRIREYIKGEQAKRQQVRLLTEKDVLTRIEKRACLARCVRGKSTGWPERLRAIQVDNEMTGDSVVRVEQELTLGLILRSLADTTGLPSEEEKAFIRKGSATSLTPGTVTPAPAGKEIRVPGPFDPPLPKTKI